MTGLITMPGAPRARVTRCACCGRTKTRDPEPWRPGMPMRPCDACKATGCEHKWGDEWKRGPECAVRKRNRRASGVPRARKVAR